MGGLYFVDPPGGPGLGTAAIQATFCDSCLQQGNNTGCS